MLGFSSSELDMAQKRARSFFFLTDGSSYREANGFSFFSSMAAGARGAAARGISNAWGRQREGVVADGMASVFCSPIY
jgi:hypothetical protein